MFGCDRCPALHSRPERPAVLYFLSATPDSWHERRVWRERRERRERRESHAHESGANGMLPNNLRLTRKYARVQVYVCGHFL